MKKDPLLFVSYHPFRTSPFTFGHMNYVLLVLLVPSIVYGMMVYGMLAARVIASALFFSVLWDMVYERIGKKKSTIHDGNAVLTGALLGMLLPPLTPWWIIAVSSGAALFLGKQLFGGPGGSPFNAVCIGAAVIMISWPDLLDPTFGSVGLTFPGSTAFPLSELHRLGAGVHAAFPLKTLLFGPQAGAVGTAAPYLLLLCGIIGIALRIIPWQIPLSIVAGMSLSAFFLMGMKIPFAGEPLFHIVTGFSCIGAFFIAADFSSRPVAPRMMVLYGFLIGVVTVLFRVLGKYPEGFPFAVLLVNLCLPLFDRGRAPATEKVPEVIRL